MVKIDFTLRELQEIASDFDEAASVDDCPESWALHKNIQMKAEEVPEEVRRFVLRTMLIQDFEVERKKAQDIVDKLHEVK